MLDSLLLGGSWTGDTDAAVWTSSAPSSPSPDDWTAEEPGQRYRGGEGGFVIKSRWSQTSVSHVGGCGQAAVTVSAALVSSALGGEEEEQADAVEAYRRRSIARRTEEGIYFLPLRKPQSK